MTRGEILARKVFKFVRCEHGYAQRLSGEWGVKPYMVRLWKSERKIPEVHCDRIEGWLVAQKGGSNGA